MTYLPLPLSEPESEPDPESQAPCRPFALFYLLTVGVGTVVPIWKRSGEVDEFVEIDRQPGCVIGDKVPPLSTLGMIYIASRMVCFVHVYIEKRWSLGEHETVRMNQAQYQYHNEKAKIGRLHPTR